MAATRHSAKPTFNAAARLVSQKLGHYRLLNLLGVGGQAAVYLARDELTNIDVGLKVFPRSPNDPREARLLREAHIAERLNHPHILRMLEINNNDQWHYVAMEFCNGGSLATELKQRGVMSAERVRVVFEQIGDALYYAHNKGLIHRDVKPGNILLTVPTRHAPAVMKLADFGLAAMLSGEGGLEKAAGTPFFLAPEIWQGRPASPQSDFYALGVTAYQLLTARHPYDADNREDLARQHVLSPIPQARDVRPDVPEALQEILNRCLAKEPADRFGSGAELSRAAASIAHVTANVKLQLDNSEIREVRAKAFDSTGMRTVRPSPGSAPASTGGASGSVGSDDPRQMELVQALSDEQTRREAAWTSSASQPVTTLPPLGRTTVGAPGAPRAPGRPAARPSAARRSQSFLIFAVLGGFVLVSILAIVAAILFAR